MDTLIAQLPTPDVLASFWSAPVVASNIIIFFTVLGALLLGLLVGYERSYHGRAAGMRTYGLVCMASAALTVIAGHPADWYGGQLVTSVSAADPTRVIQGIVSGIGFLCAGVIMKEGFNISGLTTAASIWATSVIGVLVGVGFYLAAILLTLLSALCMVGIPKIAAHLPLRKAISVQLQFAEGASPGLENLNEAAKARGYEIAPGSISVSMRDRRIELHFVAVAFHRNSGAPVNELAEELSKVEDVVGFNLLHARN